MGIISNNCLKPNKRIAIFYPWGNLGAFTHLRDAIVLLVEHGYAVDLFTQSDVSRPAPGLDLPGFTLFNRPEASLFCIDHYPWFVRRFHKGRRFGAWLEMNLIRPMKRPAFHSFLRERHASQAYTCFIGMDPQGLVSAEPLAKMLSVPLIYWSLELMFKEELISSEQNDLKSREINASRQTAFTIVQDEWRGRALIAENGLEPSRILYVPNAPRGQARRQKSDYLHRRLNISPDRTVILYTGNFDRWTMAAEIVAVTADWPDNYVLVMQSPSASQSGHLDKYMNDLLKLVDPKKVIISFDPVPQSDFRCFVDSADIGLAFYRSATKQYSTMHGKNIFLMGLSSGKIAGYLRSGLPIIVNDAVIGPGELVKTALCGICLEKPEEIKDAVALICDNYDWYTANACRCFDQQLELERQFSLVIKQLDAVFS